LGKVLIRCAFFYVVGRINECVIRGLKGCHLY
jgi:hypothetical protein